MQHSNFSNSKNEKNTANPFKKFLLGLSCISFPFWANAQTTVNTTGGTATISGEVYSYSIGEMVLVNTASTSNNFFTQGLLQNDDANLEIHNSQYLSEGLELYPNPVSNIVNLQASLHGGGKLSLELFDLRGKLVFHRQVKLISGTEKQQMGLSTLQEGTYLLQAVLKQNEKIYRYSFKVIKHSRQ